MLHQEVPKHKAWASPQRDGLRRETEIQHHLRRVIIYTLNPCLAHLFVTPNKGEPYASLAEKKLDRV